MFNIFFSAPPLLKKKKDQNIECNNAAHAALKNGRNNIKWNIEGRRGAEHFKKVGLFGNLFPGL